MSEEIFIAIVERDNGDFNIFATKDDAFVLQGGLTYEELKQFLHEGRKAIASANKKRKFVKEFKHAK